MLVRDIVDSVDVRDGDGVNLDFEPLPSTVSREFLQLVRELREGLDAVDHRLQLTFDLPPSVEGYRLKRLVAPDAADAVVLMGYEYRTASSRDGGTGRATARSRWARPARLGQACARARAG